MQATPDVGRCRQEQVAQHAGDAIEHRVVGGQRVGIAAGEFRDLGLRGRDPAPDDERAIVRQRQEIRHRTEHDPEPVLGEPEIADHLRVQEADRVARGRIAEARVEFLGDRRAAEHAAPLEHADLEPALGEIRGAHEAVVSAADEDGVEAAGLGHGRCAGAFPESANLRRR